MKNKDEQKLTIIVIIQIKKQKVTLKMGNRKIQIAKENDNEVHVIPEVQLSPS